MAMLTTSGKTNCLVIWFFNLDLIVKCKLKLAL